MPAKKTTSVSTLLSERKKLPRLPIGFVPRVIVKFKDDAAPEYRDGALSDQNWNRLLEKYPGIKLKILFTTVNPERIRELEERAAHKQSRQRLPNFLSYFSIVGLNITDAPAIAKEVSSWNRVEMAYVDPPCRNPDETSEYMGALMANLSSSGSDVYLSAVNAPFAWQYAGGDGAGQHLVDLEQGWDFCHPDLVAHFQAQQSPLLAGINGSGNLNHGTRVLGVICGHPPNGSPSQGRCIGITPNLASVVAVSYASGNPSSFPQTCVGALPNQPISRNDAIIQAISHLQAKGGGVLLLEAEIGAAEASIFGPWAKSDHPIEIIPTDFAQILLAGGNNIVVVEAAGNAEADLDQYRDQAGKNTLEVWLPHPNDPNEKIPNPDFKESGAIMVGAVRQNMRPRSNFGSRVNCFALGEKVFSANVGGGYTHLFNGSSSASAIIAGVALSVLGVIANNGLPAKNPQQIRKLLSDSAFGTNPASGSRPIGSMPDLQKIIQGGLGL